MSQEYQDLGAEYEVLAGTIKQMEIQITDPETSQNLDITDTTIFATATAELFKPNGNLLCAPVTAQYSDRPNSIVEFQTIAFPNTLAGNWKGVIKMYNNANQLINQQFFNFNILKTRG